MSTAKIEKYLEESKKIMFGKMQKQLRNAQYYVNKNNRLIIKQKKNKTPLR